MRIGIGTYALFWECSDRVPNPITLPGMIDRTAELGCNVFQICDYPVIETYTAEHLEELRDYSAAHGVELELGTRGAHRDHLNTYLDMAAQLDARVLRSMIQVGSGMPTADEVVEHVRSVLPRLEELKVDLAFETYEQLPTEQLVDIIRRIDHPRVGIALDPANCVAALEHPKDVIERCAPYTLNLHVKDFAFSRQAGWVGFTYAGAKMGEGLLDYAAELAAVRPIERQMSQIVEHWLVWQGDPDTTIAREREWTAHAVDVIKKHAKNYEESNCSS
ncbi:sugar phosphate isomerase/epimerase family protein [Trueperella sp. LYQ143]|uniref:sugar phosphate isomerase/epimerase family protein n=1 Tax=Trueperella sp. LYQ143 TaxID=3391059 RepID=UPI003982F0B9